MRVRATACAAPPVVEAVKPAHPIDLRFLTQWQHGVVAKPDKEIKDQKGTLLFHRLCQILRSNESGRSRPYLEISTRKRAKRREKMPEPRRENTRGSRSGDAWPLCHSSLSATHVVVSTMP